MLTTQLNILAQLAGVDNDVAHQENQMILQIGKANGIPEEEIIKIIEQPSKEIKNLETLTDDDRFEYLYNVVQLMKIDGKVYKSEIVFCEDIAQRLGYKRSVIKEISSRVYSDPTITADRDSLKEKAQKYLVK